MSSRPRGSQPPAESLGTRVSMLVSCGLLNKLPHTRFQWMLEDVPSLFALPPSPAPQSCLIIRGNAPESDLLFTID